ncbi:MAG: hypothetical protein J6J60_01805 [Clostridia bacterium]|nr:hypothetical protein [Clostridia bacterium]
MSEVKIDLKKILEMGLFSMNKNKENIEKKKELLSKITQNYLEVLNVNSNFLNKPAIIERVKNIIFNNLLLSENLQFKDNGIISKDFENGTQKILSVLNNGSIIFYQERELENLIVSFDELEEGIACRFFKYFKSGTLKSEERVILDNYGFDKCFYENVNIIGERAKIEKNREKFKHIITYLTEKEITAFFDWGNHSITPFQDNKFLCAEEAEKIAKDELFEENRYQSISLDNSDNWVDVFPLDVPEMDDFSISKVKSSYIYYTNNYPLSKEWFINRYGKQFLIDNNIISQEEKIEEESFLEKLSLATEEEVILKFKKISRTDFRYDELMNIIQNMYLKNMYGKAMVFVDLLTDEQKIDFLNSEVEYENDFISSCICCIDNDLKKQEQYIEFFDQLSLDNKISIISSIENEDDKVSLYEDIIEEIIEFDFEQEENFEEEEENDSSEIIYLSEKVLDSLNDKENIKEFILKFSNFPIIKYENIKDMTKDDIDYLMENLEGDLDIDGSIALLQTGYLEDEYILDLLKNNWYEGYEISKDDEFEEELACSFKVYALKKVREKEKRFEFLDDYQEDFLPEEISILLEDIEDSEELLNLAEKYNLPQDYVYGLIAFYDDDTKINFLNSQKVIQSENFIRVASAIEDIPKAFDFITQTKKIDMITKLRAISELNMELLEDVDEMDLFEKKFDFLVQNSKSIFKSIKSVDDKQMLNLYISEFWCDDGKMAEIEKLLEKAIDDECK